MSITSLIVPNPAHVPDVQAALQELLGVRGTVPPRSPQSQDTGRGLDPTTTLMIVLAIPPAALATLELGQRLKVGEALKRLKHRLAGKGVAMQSDTGASHPLDTTSPAVLLTAAHAANPQPIWDAFVSYASPDRQAAVELVDALQPLRVFIDVRHLELGTTWHAALYNAQRTARATIVLASQQWKTAWYQQEEIIRAIQLKRAFGHSVLPIYLDGRPHDPEDVPPGLTVLQSIEVGNRGMNGVAETVRAVLERPAEIA